MIRNIRVLWTDAIEVVLIHNIPDAVTAY
jgi:hypothetical protein